jgi:hypothetical protein
MNKIEWRGEDKTFILRKDSEKIPVNLPSFIGEPGRSDQIALVQD